MNKCVVCLNTLFAINILITSRGYFSEKLVLLYVTYKYCANISTVDTSSKLWETYLSKIIPILTVVFFCKSSHGITLIWPHSSFCKKYFVVNSNLICAKGFKVTFSSCLDRYDFWKDMTRSSSMCTRSVPLALM